MFVCVGDKHLLGQTKHDGQGAKDGLREVHSLTSIFVFVCSADVCLFCLRFVLHLFDFLMTVIRKAQ